MCGKGRQPDDAPIVDTRHVKIEKYYHGCPKFQGAGAQHMTSSFSISRVKGSIASPPLLAQRVSDAGIRYHSCAYTNALR